MNQNLRSILKELGLPNRFEIIRILSCQQANLSQIYNHVMNTGTKMSMSGVSRCVNSLVNLDLVDKTDDGRYDITGLGLLILDVISKLDKIFIYKEDLVDAIEFMKVIPAEFKLGLANLTKAEVERDIYVAIKRAIDEISRAKMWCKCVCRIMECEIFRMLVRNYLRGVRDKMISSTDTLSDRLELLIKAIRLEGLSKDEIDAIRDKIEIRVLDLPFQLGIIDGRIAFFQILKPYKNTPAYISTDRDFVNWANSLFDYFWEMAKPVKIPFEKALEN